MADISVGRQRAGKIGRARPDRKRRERKFQVQFPILQRYGGIAHSWMVSLVKSIIDISTKYCVDVVYWEFLQHRFPSDFSLTYVDSIILSSSSSTLCSGSYANICRSLGPRGEIVKFWHRGI